MPELKQSFSQGDLVAGNYQVLSIAGSGGMGVVYRALDLRLERTVALKFLPPELNAGNRDKERFLREARTASSLDHPNIGVIHGIEETAFGQTFIVMAYYEGASLAEHIRRGPLPVHEAIRIASQMANGLAEAHSRGIVHRDIKPSNVMITATGAVKIVDFGLARVVGEMTTSQNVVSGTALYMSPEQVMGRSLDSRCDIWALGIVFAEMLLARSPFQGETVPATLYAIINDPPQQIDTLPPALQPVLYRALAKDVSRRYPSCGEFLADLELAASQIRPAAQPLSDGTATLHLLPGSGRPSRSNRSSSLSAIVRSAKADASCPVWSRRTREISPFTKVLFSAGAVILALALAVFFIPRLRQRAASIFFGAPSEKHVAVLPFDNIGGNPQNAALADGLMDSLTGRLSNLDTGNKSLWVVPDSVVRKYKVVDPDTALKELGANLVVKGSVQRDGNDIHLTVNLIDANNLRQLGSDELETRSGDLSTLENDAVTSLARMMKISVSAAALHTADGSANPAAFEDYLTALGYTQRFDKAGNLDLAIAALQRALQTDPNFALGYAQLGEVYRLKYSVEKNTHWLDEALANCQKAAQLDNHAPSVYVTLAHVHDSLGKHDLALAEFHQALNLDPKNALALGGLARSYEESGRIDDAEKTFQQAADLRPDDWYGYNALGAFYHRQGKYPQAIAAYRKALQITPDNAEIYSNLGATYIDQGGKESLANAMQALEKSIALNPTYPAYGNLGNLYLQQKRYQEAAAVTEKALQIDGHDYDVWNNLAIAYRGSGQPEKAATADHKAEQLAEHAVALNPRDAEAQSSLAGYYAGDKMTEKALERIRTALALAPDDPNVLSNVGAAYEALGQRDRALQSILKAMRKGYALDDLISNPDLQSLIKDPRFKPPAK
ncbi:MAG: tetratricopeptide repeat protein [Terracidiphilus sp.]|jgi:serine/threonine-protein kinase